MRKMQIRWGADRWHIKRPGSWRTCYCGFEARKNVPDRERKSLSRVPGALDICRRCLAIMKEGK